MKFKTKQKELCAALQNLARNTTEKMPIFNGILIEKHSNDRLKLTATNGAVTMVYKIPATNINGDNVLVNARKFTDIVLRLSGDILLDENTIKSGKSKIKIETYTKDKFVPVEDLEVALVKINGDEFKNALKGRLFACDNIYNSVISGININKTDVVATNGNVLALYKLSKELPFEAITISKELALEVVKTFETSDIELGMTSNRVKIANGDITIYGHLLQGAYPRYQQLLPTTRYSVQLDKSMLISMLELLSLTADTTKRYCTLSFSKNKLTLLTANGNTELDVDYTDVDMSINFSINLLLLTLKNINSDVISFKFTTPLNACVIEANQEISLIMPLKVE